MSFERHLETVKLGQQTLETTEKAVSLRCCFCAQLRLVLRHKYAQLNSVIVI